MHEYEAGEAILLLLRPWHAGEPVSRCKHETERSGGTARAQLHWRKKSARPAAAQPLETTVPSGHSRLRGRHAQVESPVLGGRAQPQPCAPGSSSSSGASSCTLCTTGKYSPSSGASACTECAAGTYSAATGASKPSSCRSCWAGSSSSSSSSSNCTLCAAASTLLSRGRVRAQSAPRARIPQRLEPQPLPQPLPLRNPFRTRTIW